MSWAWVRVDASLSANHKVLALLEKRGGDHALCVFVFGLGYCMSSNSDGFIPKSALGLFHAKTKDAALLVDVGLWHEIAGGWDVNDWADYQPTSEEAQKRTEKARKAAAARWGKSAQAPAEVMPEAMLRALPDDAPSIAPAMPRTNVRNERTNADQDSGAKPYVSERARGKAEAQRELEELNRRQRRGGAA